MIVKRIELLLHLDDQTDMKLACLKCGQGNRVPETGLQLGPKCGKCGASLIQATPTEVSLDILRKAEKLDDFPLVVDFWAAWCGPCGMMAPEFVKAAQLLKGRARFAKLDTEAFHAAGTLYDIRGIPLLITFHGGREIGRRTGVTSAGEIADWVGSATNAA